MAIATIARAETGRRLVILLLLFCFSKACVGSQYSTNVLVRGLAGRSAPLGARHPGSSAAMASTLYSLSLAWLKVQCTGYGAKAAGFRQNAETASQALGKLLIESTNEGLSTYLRAAYSLRLLAGKLKHYVHC